MLLLNTGGVVYTAPIKMGEPPVGVVYQLNVVPDVVDDAVKVAVCPGLTVCVGGVTATSGTVAALTVTAPLALVAETAPLAVTTASA